MSRSSQRPPRCPFQSKAQGSPFHVDDAIGPTSRLHRFGSQESYFEEQPLWIDDLLGDSEMSPRGALRRSASDSAALLDALSDDFDDPEGEILPPAGLGVELEAACVYGPNSPRHKADLTQSESAIVSAFWDNVPQLQFQSSDSNPLLGGEAQYPNLHSSPPIPPADFASERASRRHYGQRSRVRKLQYIAELERTVGVFQSLEADLAAQVAALYQRRAVLYEENATLKQRIAGLRKEKMIKDGQQQYLKNELKRMKAVVGHHRKTKSSSSFDRVSLDAAWQSLDMAKLSLG